jgi:hypothetical protein
VGGAMTRDEILNMPAGRAMDALIAEKVFENKLKRAGEIVSLWEMPPGTQLVGFQRGEKVELVHDVWAKGEPKAYSTDIAAAWGVVEGQEEFYFEFKNGKYFAMIADNFETSNEADAAPLAICRAALLAVMPL